VYLIAGLGNPGIRYRNTRHNVGFMLVDRLAARAGVPFSSFHKLAVFSRAMIADRGVILAKPQTYMNLSGVAVGDLVRYFGLDPSQCLTVYDDVALPLGNIRFRRSGSSGGHKGMQSIITHLGTRDLARLRIGIGGGASPGALTGFVLGRFRGSEKPRLEEVLERCEEAVEVYLREGIDRAMGLFNARTGPDTDT
jgi:peptidyl-tRNA hydrolase, PTH1 family